MEGWCALFMLIIRSGRIWRSSSRSKVFRIRGYSRPYHADMHIYLPYSRNQNQRTKERRKTWTYTFELVIPAPSRTATGKAGGSGGALFTTSSRAHLGAGLASGTTGLLGAGEGAGAALAVGVVALGAHGSLGAELAGELLVVVGELADAVGSDPVVPAGLPALVVDAVHDVVGGGAAAVAGARTGLAAAVLTAVARGGGGCGLADVDDLRLVHQVSVEAEDLLLLGVRRRMVMLGRRHGSRRFACLLWVFRCLAE